MNKFVFSNKFLIFLLFISSVFSTFFSAFANDSFVNIDTYTLKKQNEEFKYSLEIPVLSNSSNEFLEKKLNQEFKNNAIILKDELAKDSSDYAKECKIEGFTIRPYILSTDYEVKYNRNDLLSIKNGYYEYTGGAHGNYYYRCSTIDFKNNKELKLKDLFKKDYNFEKVISDEILKQISSNKDIYFKSALEYVKKIPLDQQFYIQSDTLVVYYDLYEIAPFSSGVPEFKIPIKMFSNNMNYSFQIK